MSDPIMRAREPAPPETRWEALRFAACALFVLFCFVAIVGGISNMIMEGRWIP